MSFKDIRIDSSKRCKENAGVLAIITLIFMLFNLICNVGNVKNNDVNETKLTINYLGIFSLLFAGAFTYGYAYVIRKNFNNEKPIVTDLFTGFKRFGDTFIMNLLQTIYITLWTMLFIVPGIIKMISYSMSYYIMLDNPELSPNQCITKSKEIMRGHKWDYFCLIISYLGWIILCVLTLGILTLWVVPKINTSCYNFYKLILEEKE